MHIVYSPQVIDFVAMATETCRLLEQSASAERDDVMARLLRLLPMLYARTLLLPETDGGDAYAAESYVTEQDYEWLRTNLSVLFAEHDEFEEMVYDEGVVTGETRWRRLSECLADIYQPLRNFLETYRGGIEVNIEESLWAVRDNFELYWGGDLVDALRHMHRLTYIDEARLS